MRVRSQNILILVLAFTLITITAILVYINYLNKESVHDAAKQKFQEIPPTITIAPKDNSSYQIPDNGQEPGYEDNLIRTKPLVKWDEQASQALFNKVLTRQELSGTDLEAKYKTIEKFLPEDAWSGTLYTSNNIIIDYVSGNTDAWEVKIQTIDINKAKEEAAKWFLEQGFSQNFICNYPVEFYLSPSTAQELGNSNIIFNPMPPNCQ